MYTEKRKYERLEVNNIECNISINQEDYNGVIKDISEEGICILIECDTNPMFLCRKAIEISFIATKNDISFNPEPITCKAQIVNALYDSYSKIRIGCEILDDLEYQRFVRLMKTNTN